MSLISWAINSPPTSTRSSITGKASCRVRTGNVSANGPTWVGIFYIWRFDRNNYKIIPWYLILTLAPVSWWPRFSPLSRPVRWLGWWLRKAWVNPTHNVTCRCPLLDTGNYNNSRRWVASRKMDFRPGRLWFEYLKSQYDRRYVCKGLKARQSKGDLWPFIIYSSINNRTKRNDRSRQDDTYHVHWFAMRSNGIQSQFRGMTE